MKLSLSLCLLLAAVSLTNSGCVPGETEFGYVQNPINIFYSMAQALEKTSDQMDRGDGDWMLLFSQRMICLYGDEDGHDFIAKALGGTVGSKNILERYEISKPILKSTQTEQLEGYGDAQAIMNATSGKSFEVNVLDKATQQIVIRSRVNCFENNEKGSCSIANLQFTSGIQKQNPVCDNLPAERL